MKTCTCNRKRRRDESEPDPVLDAKLKKIHDQQVQIGDLLIENMRLDDEINELRKANKDLQESKDKISETFDACKSMLLYNYPHMRYYRKDELVDLRMFLCGHTAHKSDIAMMRDSSGYYHCVFNCDKKSKCLYVAWLPYINMLWKAMSIKCKLCGGETLDMDEHSEACPSVLVACPHCDQDFSREVLTEHIQSQCGKISCIEHIDEIDALAEMLSISGSVQCTFYGKRDDVDLHRTSCIAHKTYESLITLRSPLVRIAN